MKYKLAESRLDDLAVTTEYFINAPDSRMSVRMPNYLSLDEHKRRLRVIVDSLNHNELRSELVSTRE